MRISSRVGLPQYQKPFQLSRMTSRVSRTQLDDVELLGDHALLVGEEGEVRA
jgi:hypothetical protein